MFPFGPPDQPGPVRHIAYVLATDSKPKVPMLLLAYTSSGPWRGAAARLPLGVIEFDDAAARAVGQKPFHIDLRCLAQVPLMTALREGGDDGRPVAAVAPDSEVGRVFAQLAHKIAVEMKPKKNPPNYARLTAV